MKKLFGQTGRTAGWNSSTAGCVNRLPALLALLVSTIVCGCGYTTRANFLPAHIQSVHVETFNNQTDEPGLEQLLRGEMERAFREDGTVKVSSSPAADAVLRGKIIGYTRQAVRFEDNETVREYRLTVTVDFEFIDSVSGQPIVRDPRFSGEASFYLSGPLASSENDARTKALLDVSHRILNRVFTLW